MQLELIPAILVKTREDLVERIELVKKYVKTVQIDIMDNEFVPNKTIGLESLRDLPKGVQYEFHWMVHNPEFWIKQIKGNHLHIVHIEAEMNWENVKLVVRENGGRLGIALNPETSVNYIFPYEKDVKYVLAMTVRPGFDGQSYIKEVEKKIEKIKLRYPEFDIEVDGGINIETIGGAVKAGANKLVAASAIFSKPDIGKAITELKKAAEASS
ncbi:MAG: ribulose-phosphate 3-epimerase [Candidatus Micrarchaeota archaeon]|nr:ribulose-phosphate 3-epimerase [Candidatus Micrarchaeota archaeon]